MVRNRIALRSVKRTEFFLSLVVNGDSSAGRVCFYSVWDAEDAPLASRLCALFRRKYATPTLSAIFPPEFEYAPAQALGDDDAFLIRDEIERLREVALKGKARLGDPGHLHRLLLLGEAGRTQVASFCFHQAAVWEAKLRQGMARETGATPKSGAERPPRAPRRLPAPAKKKRAERAAGIEALKKELVEHVRAARDNAQEAVDRDVKPALLPRPRKQELARRAGVGPHTVTRCFQDSPDLQRLWSLAADLDAILKYAR